MKENRLINWLGMALIALALLSACAAATPVPKESPVVNNGVPATEAAAAPSYGGDVAQSGAAGMPAATGAAAPAYGGGYDAGPSAEKSSNGAVAVAPAGGGPAVAVPPGSSGGAPVYSPPDQQFQGMTAGEVDDNKDFPAYLQYRLDYNRFSGLPVHDLDITERHAIRVRTTDGQPVLAAQIMIYDGQTLITSLRTTASGIAYFFPLIYPQNSQSQGYTVIVQKDQASQTFTLTRQSKDDVWEVKLGVNPTQPPVQLDVLFLLDSTGSMGDEIDQLKNNILSISAQIAALPSRPDTRYGLVTYRDRGDQYVTRIQDFTPNVQEFQAFLQSVQAAAGGDNPESLNEGLHRAVSDVHWRVDNTVSLMFLVADAPPHLDYPQDYDYAQEVQNAAAMGIKIEPIAASGMNSQGEYVFRQLGQFTGGHFIFLTYADKPQTSGEPGTDMHVQEGQYSVQDLDALVVRLVQDELAQLNAQQ